MEPSVIERDNVQCVKWHGLNKLICNRTENYICLKKPSANDVDRLWEEEKTRISSIT